MDWCLVMFAEKLWTELYLLNLSVKEWAGHKKTLPNKSQGGKNKYQYNLRQCVYALSKL
jgi:hypothetical protein